MKHAKIKISGRVQGVGFRYSAQDKARELDIKGFARNDTDGSVYIEAEGGEEHLRKFLEWCKKGPWLAKVSKVDDEISDNLRGFEGFEIQ